MGAEFNFETLMGKTAEEVRKEGLEVIDQAAWDYGHAGYTGSFAEAQGVELRPEKFPTAEAAEEWLSENCQKWEAALIVQVIDGPYVMGAWCSS